MSIRKFFLLALTTLVVVTCSGTLGAANPNPTFECSKVGGGDQVKITSSFGGQFFLFGSTENHRRGDNGQVILNNYKDADTFPVGNWVKSGDWFRVPKDKRTIDHSGCAGVVYAGKFIPASNLTQTEIENTKSALGRQRNLSSDTYGIVPVPAWGPGIVSRVKINVDGNRVVVDLPPSTESSQWVQGRSGIGLPTGGKDGAINTGQLLREGEVYIITPQSGKPVKMTPTDDNVFTKDIDANTFQIVVLRQGQPWLWLNVGDTALGPHVTKNDGEGTHPFWGPEPYYFRIKR